MNFVQKSPLGQISIFPGVELGGSKILYGWNITFMEMAKNTFHLGLSVAESTHHSQKTFKWKLFGIEFCPKKYLRAYVYLHSEWS